MNLGAGLGAGPGCGTAEGEALYFDGHDQGIHVENSGG